MSFCGCNFRRDCTVAAFIVSLLVGVIAAFLQITAAITLTSVFFWVLFGIAIAYLVILAAATVLNGREEQNQCRCSAISALLLGILGTILFAVILLAVDFAATSILGAIIVGLLLFSFTLTITASACLVKCLSSCTG